MADNHDINYGDPRFQEVEREKTEALSELEKTYAGMTDSADKYYEAQIDASKQWADKQSQLQQEQTDFAIDKIEQGKQQTRKDYIKEQSGAYADWQKQSNEYGTNAEKMAAAGLSKTGYSESAQVSMYNTYQNRVSAARESFQNAVLNYDNAIKDARLQNNSALAEIAYNALQQQLELSLQGFQYKNQLILEKANKKTALESEYYSRYQDVLQQINAENALLEEIRQYNESMAEEKRQFDLLHPAAKGSGSGGGGGSGSGGILIPEDEDGGYTADPREIIMAGIPAAKRAQAQRQQTLAQQREQERQREQDNANLRQGSAVGLRVADVLNALLDNWKLSN